MKDLLKLSLAFAFIVLANKNRTGVATPPPIITSVAGRIPDEKIARISLSIDLAIPSDEKIEWASEEIMLRLGTKKVLGKVMSAIRAETIQMLQNDIQMGISELHYDSDAHISSVQSLDQEHGHVEKQLLNDRMTVPYSGYYDNIISKSDHFNNGFDRSLHSTLLGTASENNAVGFYASKETLLYEEDDRQLLQGCALHEIPVEIRVFVASDPNGLTWVFKSNGKDITHGGSNYIWEGDDQWYLTKTCIGKDTCSILEIIGNTNATYGGYEILVDGTKNKELNGPVEAGHSVELGPMCCEWPLVSMNIFTANLTEGASWELVNNAGEVMAKGVNESHFLCVKPSDCFTFAISGYYCYENCFASYEIVLDGKIVERRNITADNVERIGTRQCCKKPLLLQTSNFAIHGSKKRANYIMNILNYISAVDQFRDISSPQYDAACWIIYDDGMKLSSESESLIQRYVLAVFFYATGAPILLNNDDECKWWGVTCDSNRVVERIYMASEGLNGHLVSELAKLVSLKHITLDNNSLHGSIPEELGELYQLEYLSLMKNNLHGNIPEHIFSLRLLYGLDFSDNYISGTISTNFGKLINLQYLFLSKNNLSGSIPKEFYEMKKLSVLLCGDNNLNGTISTLIGLMSSLEGLILSDNGFQGSIPSTLGNTEIHYVNLKGNNFNGSIPTEIMNSQLDVLDLSENFLTGHIPSTIGNATSLIQLSLGYNHLSGTIPLSIISVQKLVAISLQSNKIEGTIMDTFANMEQLAQLSLDDNRIHGNVSDKVCEHFKKKNSDYIFTTDCAYDFIPPKVNCMCCTHCAGTYPLQSRVPTCQKGESDIAIQMNISSYTEIYGKFWILKDISNQTVLRGGPYYIFLPDVRLHVYRACAAVTNCFRFEVDYLGEIENYDRGLLPFKIEFNGEMIYDNAKAQEPIETGSIAFGYSSTDKTLKRDMCDPIFAYNRNITPGSADHLILNELVKVSGIIDIMHIGSNPNTGHKYQGPEGYSPFQRQAIDWIMKEIRNYDIFDGSYIHKLKQRYILAELYYSTNEDERSKADRFLQHEVQECEWPVITCDITHKDVVVEIDLGGMNLTGSIPSSIGKLASLEKLDLSNNKFLVGTIPEVVANMWSLTQLHLHNCNLIGTVPAAIGKMETLEEINLRNNNFVGSLPDLHQLRNLKVLDLSHNKFDGSISETSFPMESLVVLNASYNFITGPIPINIVRASSLEQLILSKNQIKGNIPENIGNKETNLSHILLDGNEIEGNIPSTLSYLTGLYELKLHDNKLTGSIPKGLGNLTKLTHLTLSYNKLKGSVSKEIGQPQNLSHIFLHGNSLTGVVDFWDKRCRKDVKFISDCGTPSAVSNPVKCECCSDCCNLENKCQSKNRDDKPVKLTIKILGSISGSLAVIAVLSASLFAHCVRKVPYRQFQPKRIEIDYVEACGKDSVYSFVFTNSLLCWFSLAVSVGIQILIFWLFLNASSLTSDESDWVYSKRCPPESLECEDEKNVTKMAWFLFGLFMILSLLKDIINGFRLIYAGGILHSSVRCLLGGLMLVFITLLAVMTSIYYNYAIAQSDTDVIVNSVILLFINAIDELMYELMASIFPKWIDSVKEEAIEYSQSLNDNAPDGITSVDADTSDEESTHVPNSTQTAQDKRISDLEEIVRTLCGKVHLLDSLNDNAPDGITTVDANTSDEESTHVPNRTQTAQDKRISELEEIVRILCDKVLLLDSSYQNSLGDITGGT